MNRLSRASVAVVVLASALWSGGVAEAGYFVSPVTVCVNASSGVVRLVASSSECVGVAQSWSALQPAPLLCWNASSLDPQVGTRKVSVAPSSGCTTPLRSVPVDNVSLLCAGGEFGVLRWPVTGSCRSGATPIRVRSAATTTTTVAPTTTTVATTTTTVATTTTTVAPTTTTTVAPTTTTTVAATTTTVAATTTTVAATTTTTVALTCANGGSCTVGVSTGPGGGIVFYAAVGTFASLGSACNTAGVGGISTCKYLEAAPTTGSSTWTDVTRSWATNINSNQSSAVSGADGTAIGTGYQNTSDIVAQSGNAAATSAAVEARAYRGPNSLSDWFLPSKDELNELCKYALNTGQGVGGAIRCTGGSSATLRGYLEAVYWSSSEVSGSTAWYQNIGSGYQSSIGKNSPSFATYVRPVRAF